MSEHACGPDCQCCDCRGCAGAPLPSRHANLPGLPAIDYRLGRYGDFRAALLAGLSSSRLPALAGLRTRASDDFSIACCDAGAVLFDVLTFYQERIANEAYLRTATERRSVAELARLIGYQPAPGVAASTQLAFQLEEAPGQPSLAAQPVTIAAGTRVQSVPGPDETPQTFETLQPVRARVHWNAIPAQQGEAQRFAFGTRECWLAGIDSQLAAGDMLLLVGRARYAGDTASRHWALRPLLAVEPDNERRITRLSWAEGLGANNLGWKEDDAVHVYALRARASLYGHNAADPRLLKLGHIPGVTTFPLGLNWANFRIVNDEIDLDSTYPKLQPGGWLVLAGGSGAVGSQDDASLPGRELLLRINNVREISRSAFGMSARITRVIGDFNFNSAPFGLRSTRVLTQSEELALAPRPLPYPVYGAELALERRVADLETGQMLALSGKRQRLRIVADDAQLKFTSDDGGVRALRPGDSLVLSAAPVWLADQNEIALPPPMLETFLQFKPTLVLRWRVYDRDGSRGRVDAACEAVALQPAAKDDAVISALVQIGQGADAVVHDRDRSTVQLTAPLPEVFDRRSFSVCANLASASHGEGVGEIAGSGDAALASQRFALKQLPQTYVSAATPTGAQATLQVRVDGQLWREVPSLYGAAPDARVYALRQDEEQRTIVQFGDNAEGARLPSGRDNLRLSYRKGLGLAGNVRAGQLTTLLGRPLGVRAVTNPAAAGGGQDAESRDDVRRNAPLPLLTLGRAVSLQDYADFARSFAGVAKASAVWMPGRGARGVFVSIAGPDGAAIASDSATFANLAKALRDYGDALIPLRLMSYKPVHFRLKAKLKVDPRFVPADTLAAVQAQLRREFAFAERDFGQNVSLDEVMATIHAVAGVQAVDVDQLYRAGAFPLLKARLFALPPQRLANGEIQPAELLLLDPGPLTLELMP